MSLVQDLLAIPVGKHKPAKSEPEFTKRVEINGLHAEVELKGSEADTAESEALRYLESKLGESAALWAVTGIRSSEWTMANGELGTSVRYTFARRGVEVERPNIDELLEAANQWVGDNYDAFAYARADEDGEDHTYIVAIGDMQFGKGDGDGVDGTLCRTIDCIDKAAVVLAEHRKRFNIDHVHIAWLGDHIEGFMSQGGANGWRTKLTLNEQLRLTRRVMLHAMLTFAPLCKKLTMVAIPGNHGEPVRFAGKGLTRFDDSHDTEALVHVAEVAEMMPERFSHVEFLLPDTDELIVVADCSGSVVAHAHGHMWNANKHFDWWKGQAFNRESAMHEADVLLAGHYHHEHIEADGPRTYIGVPALESESTWWRHKTGTAGSPGLIVAVTKGGRVPVKEVISA